MGERTQRRVHRRHHARRKRDELRIGLKTMAAAHPVAHGGQVLVGGIVIPEYIIASSIHKRLDDGRRRDELHIRHRQRQHILMTDTQLGLDHLPFHRSCVVPLWPGFEIVHIPFPSVAAVCSLIRWVSLTSPCYGGNTTVHEWVTANIAPHAIGKALERMHVQGLVVRETGFEPATC